MEALLAAVSVEKVHFAGPEARRRLEPLLERWREQGADQFSLVKWNVSRTVYRAGLPGGQAALYLKHFHSRALVHRLQRRIGFADAMCEMRFSEYLSRAKVPAPRVLAASWRNGVEWLISEGVEPSMSAESWHLERLARGDHAGIRRGVLALAELVARMHRSGVVHHDLHCGNVLVRTGGDGEAGPEMVLMDLHRMSRRPRLSRRSRAANLAQLLNDRLLWTTRSQRLRFLKHYLRLTAAEGTLRGWVRLIEPIAERYRRRLYAQRERRIFSTNRYFARLKIAGYRAHVVLESKWGVPGCVGSQLSFTAEQWREALADPEALLAGPGAAVVKDSASSLVVRRTLRVGPHAVEVYVKRARRKHRIRWLTDLFRPSRALRAFRLGHSLLARRIHTALPLAAMEKRRGRLLVDSILITEAVDDALHLNKFLTRYLGNHTEGDALEAPARKRLAQQVLWQLGRLLRHLHQNRFAHRDLKAANLLVHWQGEPAVSPELTLVDLDGVRQVCHLSARREFRGLMRLNVSLLECPVVNRAGRLRMLLGYLRRPGVGRINYRPVWRLLQHWSGQKIRRQIASRRRRQKAQRRAGS